MDDEAPRFDFMAFATELRPFVTRAGGVRPAARLSGVDAATISRASSGWPSLSHENWLRLTTWMSQQQELAA